MQILANSKDPDKMLHDAAFHQGLLSFISKDYLERMKCNFYLEIITCDPSIKTMDHPMFIVSNQKEESIST